jgi:hypothetical protein
MIIGRPLLRKDSLFQVKQVFLTGEVWENLSVLNSKRELQRWEQAGAIVARAPGLMR